MGSAKGYLRDHGPMVAMLSTQIGREMGLSKAECSELFFASVLADMGMVGLAEDAWENPVSELPPDVRARVDLHPARSEERVKQIPHLEVLAPLVRHHHEWFDGCERGYPDRLKGDTIPLPGNSSLLEGVSDGQPLVATYRSAYARCRPLPRRNSSTPIR